MLAGDAEFIGEARRLKALLGVGWRSAYARLGRWEAVQTNIVFANVSGTGHSLARWVTTLAAQGLLVTTVAGKVRMLTHRDITAGDVDAALAAWRKATDDLAAQQPGQA